MAAQIPDRILMEGEWLNLYTNPLEQYWNKLGRRRPAFFAKPECTRGYVADWEIHDRGLFINGVEGKFLRRILFFWKQRRKFSIRDLFRRKIHRPVKATWYSGKLRIPVGKMTLYDHNGYDARFEKEQIITIDHGDVVKSVTLDFAQKKLIVESEVMIRSKDVE
jgi:hypothetical protein